MDNFNYHLEYFQYVSDIVEICCLLWAAVTTYSFEWKIQDQVDEQSTTKQSTNQMSKNWPQWTTVGVILTSMTEYMAPSLEDCGRMTWGMGLLCSISFLFSRFISSRLSRPFFTFTDHSGSSASCWMSRTLPRTYLYQNRYQWLDILEVHVFGNSNNVHRVKLNVSSSFYFLTPNKIS